MNTKYAFYNWFQKVISIFIDIFFVAVPIACLFVFTSPFTGTLKYVVFAVLTAIYLGAMYMFKDQVKKLISLILQKLQTIDEKKMLVILFLTMVVLKIVYTLLFSYDATSDGDIEIYNEIADGIISAGKIESNAISHLYGVALHFVLFKLLHLPLHIGMFCVIVIGTMVYFLLFKKVIGKEKAFLLILVYILMPSTCLMSFCTTHEVFVYTYLALFYLLFSMLIDTNKMTNTLLYTLLSGIILSMTCLVNPGAYIPIVILLLCILFTNLPNIKKVFMVVIIIFTLLCNQGISKALDVNEYNTTMNTYTILIHGSNPYSLGEQVDGYPLKKMRMYIYSRDDLRFSEETFKIAARHVLFEQYEYLITHPVTLLKLVMNKIYILWSGIHYPMELAYHNNAMSSLANNILLAINTFIYLFVVSLRFIYRRKQSDPVEVSVFKLELLGVIALTMLCIVANKYALYATIYIYLVSFNRIEINNE